MLDNPLNIIDKPYSLTAFIYDEVNECCLPQLNSCIKYFYYEICKLKFIVCISHGLHEIDSETKLCKIPSVGN